MYTTIAQKNPLLSLLPITSESFRQYGRIVNEYDFSPWLQVMNSISVPADGNVYVANESALSSLDPASQVQERLYAGMPIQVGYCNGNNSQLNALEYHKTSELNIAVTDLILLLADVRDIHQNTLQTGMVKGYYMPAGTACELYGTTLHFAPCKVRGEGFKCIVVLPAGTNLPLDRLPQAECNEEKLLWMKGKWLIAHKDSIPASKGAFIGIEGENIKVLY